MRSFWPTYRSTALETNDQKLVPWAPPLILPVGANGEYKTQGHLETMVKAYIKVRFSVTTIFIWRIDLTRGEILISTPGGKPYLISVPTDRHPKRPLEIIEGWPV